MLRLLIKIFRLVGHSDYKLIYRHYATLYFVFCADTAESELGILDLIQVNLLNNCLVSEKLIVSNSQIFVEVLDKCFETVCELDLIFKVDKVYIFYLFRSHIRNFHSI